MKRIRPYMFTIVLVAILPSCSYYIKKEYSGEPCFKKFSTLMIHSGWRVEDKGKEFLEFRKGISVVPTNDYEGEDLEVQVIIEKEIDHYFIEVGNYGFYPELVSMKPRFIRISSFIDKFIKNSCKQNK